MSWPQKWADSAQHIVTTNKINPGSYRVLKNNGKRSSTIVARPIRGGYSSALGTAKERKFHDVDLADSLVATAGTVHTGINLIPQGMTDITRIGRVAFIKSIYMREIFQLTESAVQGSGSDHVRTMVIWDRQANKALPTVANILSGTSSIPFLDFNNLVNKNRFTILHDKVTHIRVLAAGGNGTAIETIRNTVTKSWYKKFKMPVPIEFDGTAGAITEITSNNFIVLSIARQGIIKWDAHFRLRFTD